MLTSTVSTFRLLPDTTAEVLLYGKRRPLIGRLILDADWFIRIQVQREILLVFVCHRLTMLKTYSTDVCILL